MILVLGILGLVCCAICAPIAWIMGKNDLAKIQAGQISKEAESTTKIGMILGMVGTILIIIGIVIQLILLVMGVGMVGIGAAAGN